MQSLDEQYRTKAHFYIPGGAHTYSRADEVFPSNAPSIIERSKGVYTWDVNGNMYLDFAMACRSVTVGYDYECISNAAIEQIGKGNTASKASKIEVEAAELLCDLIPWVDMVKFAKTGSMVTTAAIKLARAYTGKKYVARCYEHPFFSYDDWFIGDTEIKRGIPAETREMTLQFHYNDINSVIRLFERWGKELSCLIMEPCGAEKPIPGFLQKIRALCDQYHIVLIMDEMITGFRWDLLGACKYYNVIPDLVTYGKGMANGFSVAALGGKREIMELGGMVPGTERVFLLSTTHGAEMSGLGAFLATIKVYQDNHVTDHIWRTGAKLCDGMMDIARDYGMERFFYLTGEVCSPTYVVCGKDGKPSNEYRTIFCQEMLNQGILMPYISLAYQHTEKEIEYTLQATRKAMAVLESALNGDPRRFISGQIIQPVFRKVN